MTSDWIHLLTRGEGKQAKSNDFSLCPLHSQAPQKVSPSLGKTWPPQFTIPGNTLYRPTQGYVSQLTSDPGKLTTKMNCHNHPSTHTHLANADKQQYWVGPRSTQENKEVPSCCPSDKKREGLGFQHFNFFISSPVHYENSTTVH